MKAMKFCITFSTILLLASFQSVVAQRFGLGNDPNKEAKTLLSKRAAITGYGIIDNRFSEIADNTAVFMGGHGGIIINRHLFLGLGGYGLLTNVEYKGVDPEQPLRAYMGYGGVHLAYVIAPKQLIHISIPTFIGIGTAEIYNKVGDMDFQGLPVDEVFIEKTGIYLFEPGIQLEINVTNFMKVCVGGNYRFIKGLDLVNDIGKDRVEGYLFNVSVVAGKF